MTARASELVVSAPHSPQLDAGDVFRGTAPIVNLPKSSHGLAMIGIGQMMKTVAVTVIMVLVAASTVIPSLSYAQKYADHLSQYGGYDARVAAISGFAALYVSPAAPMLPVVLAAPTDNPADVVLPSSCSMDKTVLPGPVIGSAPCDPDVTYSVGQTYPVGLDQPAMRGPPRRAA